MTTRSRTVLVALALLLVHRIGTPQEVAVAEDTVITLERTGGCFIVPCPTYKVTIDGRGNVTFDGDNFMIKGRHTGRIPMSSVRAILETAERIRFFELPDRYPIPYPDGTVLVINDAQKTFVTITRGGQTKRVEDVQGAPDTLKQLERELDDAADSKRWITIDGGTPRQ
jgi:hypothetical protein